MKTALILSALCFALDASAELRIDVPDCSSYGPASSNLVVTSDVMEGGTVGIGYENEAGLNDIDLVKGCDHPSLNNGSLLCKGKGEIAKVGKFRSPTDDSDDTPRATLTLNTAMNFAITGGCNAKKHEKLVFEVK